MKLYSLGFIFLWTIKLIFCEEERPVTFLNKLKDKDISVYWEGSGDDVVDEVHIVDIKANSGAEVNTFNGHRFYAKISGEDEILPDKVLITAHKELYSVGTTASCADGDSKTCTTKSWPPTPTLTAALRERKPATLSHSVAVRDRQHPQVEVMGETTTSMGAMFRCLCKSVDYWWENGEGGAYQGTLTMGKETTTNSYEGHVFFFTESGNKEKELARFTMHKDQVRRSYVLPIM
jgi:hypothetical protein